MACRGLPHRQRLWGMVLGAGVAVVTTMGYSGFLIGPALIGFTVANGATRSAGNSSRERSGGGIWCASSSAVVSNCVLTGNSANNAGGGMYSGTLTRSARLDKVVIVMPLVGRYATSTSSPAAGA